MVNSQRAPSIESQWPPPPPANETCAERDARVAKELEARRVSEGIDRSIEAERIEKKKQKPAVTILLLGQAESGKSTMLKNIQLHFAPNAFQAEVEAWRAIIYLNVTRTVNFILDAVQKRATTSVPPSSNSRLSSTFPETKPVRLSTASSRNPSDFLRLRLTLSPLRNVEEILSRRLAADELPPVHGLRSASEVSVRSGSRWKHFFRGNSSSNRRDDAGLEDSQRVIEACKSDIDALWACDAVQEWLKLEDVSLPEQSGYFLSEMNRIAAPDYQPTQNDILRARMHTVGVEQHRISPERGDNSLDWLVCDVGGAMGQRAAWAPYFDNVQVIIFVAPISAFDQNLAEDPNTNRLADTFELWKRVCSNRLLAHAQLILMLNKKDVLADKLYSGIRFAEHVPSYRGENDVDEVCNYLLHKFISQHKGCTANKKREVKHYFTCALDTRATAKVLAEIQSSILLNSLHRSYVV
ncbi:hypothetical protein PLICRDRAFT_51316 [Plicaturopsis crispa FD-325 SS-3]|nr:hypothetical protein PLICRDRAFT_51316 [Plicaturopsis crispa FD-325 SS-3]